MGYILCMDTATSVCSVALADGGLPLSFKDSFIKNAHAAFLTPSIDELIRSSGISYTSLSAVAVGMGPGSYTGLRIGIATAKGLCYALDIPLIAIPTLKAMAWGMKQITPPPALAGEGIGGWCYCPMLDARRIEVFCAVFDETLLEIRETRAEIIHEHSFSDELTTHTFIFAGEGAEKCKPFLEKHENTIFIDGFAISSKYMIPLAEEKYQRKEFEDLASFEPFYLKDFIAGKPRVKGLAT